MRDFTCPNCGQHLAFENSVCLSCGGALGFSLGERALLIIATGQGSEHGGAVDSSQYQLCANLHVAECNWLVKVDSSVGAVPKLCTSCTLTRGLPNDADTAALAAFAAAEKAKRRLIVELADLKLPIVGRDQDPAYGLAFDLLSSEAQKVVTGHHNGVITLDLAEGDDVHREQLRIAMDEPYRTLLGHFRHEIGHYYFYRLIDTSADYQQRFRALFGDPDTDYQEALDRHYRQGAPPGLEEGLRLLLCDHAPRRGLGRDLRALPAHPRHPRHLSGIRLRPVRRHLRASDTGAQRIRHHHRDVAAAGVGAQYGEPVDGARRPLPVRAAETGAGEDVVHPHHHRRDGLRSGQAGLGRRPGIARGVMAKPMHLGPPTSIGSRRGAASRRQRSSSSPRRAYAHAAMKAVADGACHYLAPQHRPGDSSGQSEEAPNA
jgi:hypothetical protein